ncbi:mediator of RNA polymerase II transcription subunit 15a [Beta vulgaris subsp. vulgaris]|uniref:mediator of RNA polymerase II transcription subunit 15a n=1 Tax=Beta vulgaris subsp. vulgaris TaxID=3555 RepID=UPI0020368A7E|nr:mediator of RNA polymerase II transcription subunit 15a [Beta vulgaris subsp. vulgaris]
MEAINTKAWLNENFRQHVIDNVIMKKLIQWGHNTRNPVFLRKLKEIAVQFEEKIYGMAKNKDDYVDKIHKKLNSITSRSFFGDAAACTAGQQPANTIISRQAVHSDQSAQRGISGSAPTQESQKLYTTQHQVHVSKQRPMHSTLQQSFVSMQPAALNPLQEDRLSERQNGLYPLVQQIRPMREPIQTTNSMLNIESRQQLSQLGGSVMKPQEQGTLYQDTRVHQSNIVRSTPLHTHTLEFENKHIPWSQVAATNAPAFTSFVDAETISAADLKRLIAQYRTSYLPDLLNFEKKVEKEFVKAQSVDRQEKAKRLRLRSQQMIKFLHLPEDDLMCIPKETVCCYLNNITEVLNRWKASSMQARNQAPQYPNRQMISLNHLQNTPSVNTTTFMSAKNQAPQYPNRQKISVNHHQNTSSVMSVENPAPQYPNRHIISSNHQQNTPSVSTTTSMSAENQAPQYPDRQSISSNNQQNTPSVGTTTSITRPIISSSTMDNSKAPNMQIMLPRGPHGTQEPSDDLMKQNPKPMQSTSMNRPPKAVHLKKPQKVPGKKDSMDLMFRPMNTKATLRNSQRQPSQARPKTPQLLKRKTSVTSSRAISQPSYSIVTIDSPSTPGTVSSVTKPIGSPAISVSPNKFGANKSQSETEVQDRSIPLGTPGASTSSLPPEFSSPESNQLPQSADLPINRLIKVLQSVSKEALKSSMDDIASAINDMDKLPEYAYDDYRVPLDNYLVNLPEAIDDEPKLPKRLKRNIESISRDISTISENHDLC